MKPATMAGFIFYTACAFPITLPVYKYVVSKTRILGHCMKSDGNRLYLYPKLFSIMGRGDKKSKRGKIFKGSFGKSRPRTAKRKAATEKKA